jgi:hypothetical protein
MLLEVIRCITKVLLLKESSKLLFPTWQVQRRAIELSYVEKVKLQKSHVLPFTNEQFIFLLYHYYCVCDISEHVSA